ncbi:MAG: ABC transporter ATP-binding protein [Crocinitomicaceae bacterium]
MSETILEIRGLTKKYGELTALNQLNLEVKSGTIYGILGPNGSGKTTTLGIVLGILNASSGSFSWFGNGELDENRKRIGALLETPNFFPYLSAVRNLEIVCKIKGLENTEVAIEEAIKKVRLWNRKDSKFKTFSLGMKQRLAIASALMGDPDVLVLDEPTNGLDPQGIREIRDLIREIANSGKTVIIASHQLDEIEKVCTDVIIIKNGVTLKESKIDEIMEGNLEVVIGTEEFDKAKTIASSMNGINNVREKEGKLYLEIDENTNAKTINEHFHKNGIVLSHLGNYKKSLEEQFLELTEEGGEQA